MLNLIYKKLASTAAWAGVMPDSVHSTNSLGDTPLHTVCTWGDLEAVRVLVGAGADVNAIGDLGSTPLLNAVIGENEAVVDFLIRNGACVRAKNSLGWTALSYARLRKKRETIIEKLKSAEAREGPA
jgi:ankyrin repeat protein